MPGAEPGNILSLEKWKELDGLGKAPKICTLRKATCSQMKQVEGMTRALEFVISDESVDRDGDVLLASGWRLDNYRKNPVVLFAHDYQRPAIGKSERISIQGGQLISIDQFATAEESAFADEIYRLIIGGYMRAVSVGFQPDEWVWVEDHNGWRFEAQDLLEHSVVPVPANPNALQLAFSKGLRFPELTGWFEKLMDGDAGTSKIFIPRPAMEDAYQLHTPSKTYLLPAAAFSKSEGPGMTKLAGHDLFISTAVAEQLGDLESVEVKETTFTEGIDMETALDRKRAIIRDAAAIVNGKNDAKAMYDAMEVLEGRAKAAGIELPWEKNTEAWKKHLSDAVAFRKEMAGSEWEDFMIPTRKLAGMLIAAGFKSEGEDVAATVAAAEGDDPPASADPPAADPPADPPAGDPPAADPPAADPPAGGDAQQLAVEAAVAKYMKDHGIDPQAASPAQISELNGVARSVGEEIAASMREGFDEKFMSLTGKVPDATTTH